MSGQSAVHACQAGTDDGADMDVAADIGIMGGRTAAWGRIFAARSESRIRSGLHWFGYYHFFINWGPTDVPLDGDLQRVPPPFQKYAAVSWAVPHPRLLLCMIEEAVRHPGGGLGDHPVYLVPGHLGWSAASGAVLQSGKTLRLVASPPLGTPGLAHAQLLGRLGYVSVLLHVADRPQAVPHVNVLGLPYAFLDCCVHIG